MMPASENGTTHSRMSPRSGVATRIRYAVPTRVPSESPSSIGISTPPDSMQFGYTTVLTICTSQSFTIDRRVRDPPSREHSSGICGVVGMNLQPFLGSTGFRRAGGGETPISLVSSVRAVPAVMRANLRGTGACSLRMSDISSAVPSVTATASPTERKIRTRVR